jgi:hypothetical protein
MAKRFFFQGFSKAVIAGTRSGSGKLVYDHYDTLRNIWAGSPNTVALTTGIDSSLANDADPMANPLQNDDSSSDCDEMD